MNKLNLMLWIVLAFIGIIITSCQKENYDETDTIKEELEPTINYTGADNQYSFAFTVSIGGNTNISGGLSVNNQISMIEEVDLFKWKITSSVQDGDFMVLAETTFFTPDKNGGTFPIDELHLLFEDGAGGSQEFSWEASQLDGNIEISTLTGTPEFVSGVIGVGILESGIDTTYQYAAEFSKIPFN